MLIKFLSDDWKWWIWNYWKLNNNKNSLFRILLNHGFEYDLIKNELNYECPESDVQVRKETQKVLENKPEVSIPPLHKALADNPKVRRLENVNLEIYEIDDFLSDSECAAVIEKMKDALIPSTVTNPETDKSVRTSTTAFLRCTDSFYSAINNKFHEFMRIPLAMGEEPQGQKYEVGQEFKPHCDWFDVNQAYNQVHLNLGQRTYTMMVYLNDVEEGGETKFTKVNFLVKPKKGKAVVWNNIDKDIKGNWFSEHWGTPVIKGEKYIITKWFREHDGTKQNANENKPA
jgi:prolyl 4-hydroxylase